MPLDVQPVDPRDRMWEMHDPKYRVYFWDVDARSDEWESPGAMFERHCSGRRTQPVAVTSRSTRSLWDRKASA
ncbi:MAG TPA: hypothetical protein VFG96_07560 [Jiangellaceae bacterium]|nr:hypothetical protein [Jiangellaceae bacterium]